MSATVSRLRPLTAADDGVRERHGVTNLDGSYAEANEDGGLIKIIVSASLTASLTISPKKARYLAGRLNRLARRIESREVGQ